MKPDISYLGAMDQLSDKPKKSAGMLLKQSLSAVVCLVALATPVSAQLTAMAPPPSPVPAPQGSNKPAASQGLQSPEGDQQRKELKKESGSEKKEKQLSGEGINPLITLAGRIDPRWFLYGTPAIVALFALWLALLTWRSFEVIALVHKKTARLHFVHKKTARLHKRMREMQDFLQNLDGTLFKQASSHAEIKELVEKISIRLQAQEDNIFAIQKNLRYQDDRFLDFQARQDEQLKRQVPQASDETLTTIDHPKSEMIADQVSSLNPAKLLASEYQEAFYLNDRTFLRRIITHELNITQTSEDILMKSASLPTQLEVVKTGGSYLLIQRDDKNWLVPDFQSLTSFTTNQLSKGIFTYIKENISTAELREPAEVREIGCLWEVIRMGIIAVPV